MKNIYNTYNTILTIQDNIDENNKTIRLIHNHIEPLLTDYNTQVYEGHSLYNSQIIITLKGTGKTAYIHVDNNIIKISHRELTTIDLNDPHSLDNLVTTINNILIP